VYNDNNTKRKGAVDMKTCGKCGKELFDEAVICPNCGCPVEGTKAVGTGDVSTVGIVIVIIGIVASVMASFLPFFRIGAIAKMSAFEGDFRIGSIVAFAILAIVLVMILRRDGGAKGYCIIGGIAVLGEALIHYLYATQRLDSVSLFGISMSNLMSLDAGFYVMLAGGILMAIGGALMPKVTARKGFIIMGVVVGLLIAAGVVVMFATSSEKPKKDEETAKTDDLNKLQDIMASAEKAAIDPAYDVQDGEEFTIWLRNGEVTLSGFYNQATLDYWKSLCGMQSVYKLESSEFAEVNGAITGKMLRTGSVWWTYRDIGSISYYLSRWFY